MNTELLQNLLSSDIIWQILIALAMLLLFRSVPKETLDKLEKRAIETESTADDMAIKVLRWLNANKELLPTILPETPTLPAPTQPTVTVSLPPQAPVGNTGSGTMDVSLPPVTTYPALPIKENKFLAPYETRLDFPQGRQVHVPVNMGYVFDLKNLAKDTEYPHPNVNINGAYGARFDIAFIAGSWGFSYLTTLVKDAEYKIAADYSADVTGNEISHLGDWLWWELETQTDNNPAVPVQPNQGIRNGARHTAEWTIKGTGLPCLLTPRIRAAWASASNNSAITWHNLTITPVELAG